MDGLRKAFDEILESRDGARSGEPIDRALEHWVLQHPQDAHPGFEDSAVRDACGEYVRGLFQCPPILADTYLIYKSAYAGLDTPWHQDRAYLDTTPTLRLVTFWLALQPTGVENSCLWFVPGSHRQALRKHTDAGRAGTIATLKTEPGGDELERAVAAPLEAGCATLHTDMTLHYAAPNRSSLPRRAWVLDFAVPAHLFEWVLSPAEVNA